MRIFLAGATGVIGRLVVPLRVGAGHEVAGMTRSPDKAESLTRQGAVPIGRDVYDAAALLGVAEGFEPELVMHQLTALPDEADRIPEHVERNNRIRTEGTRNPLAASQRVGARRFLAQSIASRTSRWRGGGRRARAARGRRRRGRAPLRRLPRPWHLLGHRPAAVADA